MVKRRVVITGTGPVTAIGIGQESFFTGVLNHKTVIRQIPEEFEKNYTFKSRFFVPAPKFSLSDFGVPGSLEKAMEKTAKLAVAGAKLALEDAGFDIRPGKRYFQGNLPQASDVIVGVGMGSLQTALDSYVAHTIGADKEVRFNRLVIPMLMPNAASAWISILFGIRGVNYTINASCASGTCAIGEAYRRIQNGSSDLVITGGVECLAEKYGAVMRGFDQLQVLTRSETGNPMPFSQNRSGFLFNEGAGCILVLEELKAAQKRGVPIYAEISGYQFNSDGFNIVQVDSSGQQVKDLLRKLAKDHPIDYFNAHGTGTWTNDEMEAAVIQEVFGDQPNQPLINSTKGILGHSIGASGALEAAVTALSIFHAKVHGNTIENPIANLNLVRETVEREIQSGISASYGFGGHNAALLLQRYDQKNE